MVLPQKELVQSRVSLMETIYFPFRKNVLGVLVYRHFIILLKLLQNKLFSKVTYYKKANIHTQYMTQH